MAARERLPHGVGVGVGVNTSWPEIAAGMVILSALEGPRGALRSGGSGFSLAGGVEVNSSPSSLSG